MFFILAIFSGILGHFEGGTERPFAPATALLLKESGIVTPLGSLAHKPWLEAHAPAAPAPPAAPEEPATDTGIPTLETKPEPVPALETKPAPGGVRSEW